MRRDEESRVIGVHGDKALACMILWTVLYLLMEALRASISDKRRISFGI